MNTTGFYVFCSPDHQVSEFEAKLLISKVLSNKIQVHWEYNPRSTSLNAFAGNGINGITDRFELSMHSVPRQNPRILLEHWQDGKHICAITDLCHIPEQSELRSLYMQVASIVHQNPKPKFRYSFSMQGAMPAK